MLVWKLRLQAIILGRHAMRTLKALLWVGCLVIFILGCASAKPAADVKMTVPSETILSNKKIVIVPASVIHAYTGRGDEVDRCLIDRPEIWQDEIVLHLRKAFTAKGRHVEILAAPPDELRDNVDAVMREVASGNRLSAEKTFPFVAAVPDDFKKRLTRSLQQMYLSRRPARSEKSPEERGMDPDNIGPMVLSSLELTEGGGLSASPAGKMDEQQYPVVMSRLADAYQGLVVIPKVIARGAAWTRGGLFSFGKAPKVEWDGVSRKPDTTGGKWSRLLGAVGSGGPPEETGGSLGVIRAVSKVTQATKDANEGGKIDVYSLHVDIFDASGLVFSSNGGFDTRQLVDSKARAVERANLCQDLFDERNKDNVAEAILVAFEPLFQ